MLCCVLGCVVPFCVVSGCVVLCYVLAPLVRLGVWVRVCEGVLCCVVR